VILLIALVWFFVTNSAQQVDINLFGRSFLGISVYWVVVASLLVGFVTNFVLAAAREFGFHRQISRLKKDSAAKDREIAELRTLPLSRATPAGKDGQR
jgi:uncharacterized integral membrane protein